MSGRRGEGKKRMHKVGDWTAHIINLGEGLAKPCVWT